jgi:hypothetical protein
MSIGNWFKRIFSSPAPTDAPADVAAETNDEIDINEARIDAGGSGPVGFPGEPDTHASPGDAIADSEADA